MAFLRASDGFMESIVRPLAAHLLSLPLIRARFEENLSRSLREERGEGGWQS
jgi:hypothetical protein